MGCHCSSDYRGQLEERVMNGTVTAVVISRVIWKSGVMNGTVTAVVITGVIWKSGVMNGTVIAVVITGVSWKNGIMNVTVTAVVITGVGCWWGQSLAWRFTLCWRSASTTAPWITWWTLPPPAGCRNTWPTWAKGGWGAVVFIHTLEKG